MNRGDEVTLTIESLSGDGKAVGRLDGLVFFVEKAVPGDTVLAKVWKVQRNFVEASATQILTPSPLRVDPRCRYFGTCGGCTWQQLSYNAQLDYKTRRVGDAFRHVGGFSDVRIAPILGCEEPYFYRNKMEFTFSNSRWLTTEEMLRKDEIAREVALGLHVPGRYDKIVDLQECWLQSEQSAAIVNTIREVAKAWNLTVYSTETHEGYLRHLVIRDGKRSGELMVNLVTSRRWEEGMRKLTELLLKHFPGITTIVNNITTRKSMVAVGESEDVYFGPGYITEKMGQHEFRISANSFFQTNSLQAERLYETVRSLSDLRPEDVVYDLYSGTGTIAIFLSDCAERVIGIELVESAIRDAETNARVNHVSNCYFLLGDLKDRLTRDSSWLSDHPRPTVVVADPPRSGMHQKVVEQILRLAPERIVYVSCNPATQARDAKLLAEGGYGIEVIQPVDMFPHTDHIEAVALLRRSS